MPRREVLISPDALLDQQYALKALEADHLLAMVDVIQVLGGGYFSGIDQPHPHLAPEAALSGIESSSPAGLLESISSPPSPLS
jgi:hypothetical protein